MRLMSPGTEETLKGIRSKEVNIEIPYHQLWT
jgi:hypothetical protein